MTHKLISPGAWWLGFSGTLQPAFNAYGAYATDPSNPATGAETPAFHSSFAFILLAMGLLSFVYLILSLRTNIVYFMIFLTLLLTFCCLAGGDWQLANGNKDLAGGLQMAGGVFGLISCACGWWIFFAIMLEALDFPFKLPGKLSATMNSGHS